jgi:hypothetical protein
LATDESYIKTKNKGKMSRYQMDPVYRAKVKARNKEFQQCLREDSRRMDWLRTKLNEDPPPTHDEIRTVVNDDPFGTTLPDGKKRRANYQYCDTEEL